MAERFHTLAATYSKLMIETLLNVHALTNMYAASENEEYRKSAAGWLESLEHQLASLKHELTKNRNGEE